jgi:hypothetical protein
MAHIRNDIERVNCGRLAQMYFALAFDGLVIPRSLLPSMLAITYPGATCFI